MKRLLKKWWFWVYIVIPAIWIIGITVYFTCIQPHYNIAFQEGVYTNSQDIFYDGQIIEKFEITLTEIDYKTYDKADCFNVIKSRSNSDCYAMTILIQFYKQAEQQISAVYLTTGYPMQHEVYYLQIQNEDSVFPLSVIKLRLVGNKTAEAIDVDLHNNPKGKFYESLSLVLQEDKPL